MPIYVGKGVPGEPGFECKKFEGFHLSPNGEYWGSEPIGDDGEFIDWKSKRKKFKHRSKYHK